MIDYRFYVSNIYSWLTMSLIVASSTHRWGKCYQGGCSSKARETFRAHSPSVSKNGKSVYARKFLYERNLWSYKEYVNETARL